MRFDERFLDEIKSRLRPSDVIGKTVKLRRQGREYVGLSPFTKEKTPSFYVNGDKGQFFDFSSGKTGDLITFLQETERLSFTEAVERLAAEAGVPLPAVDPRAAEQEKVRQGLAEWLELAVQWFEAELRRPVGRDARTRDDIRGELRLADAREFVASFAHPGGNVTGFANNNSALGGKWVQLLKELAPRTARVALLSNQATGAPLQLFMPSIQAAASSIAVEVSPAPVQATDEIESIIAGQARSPGGGLVVMPAAFSVTNRDLIIALAARYGVPTIYFNRLFAESGGLVAYSADFVEQLRAAAGYVDRILKGAKPGDLPVQTPTKYELLINLKTAKALALDVPPHLQQLADELIE